MEVYVLKKNEDSSSYDFVKDNSCPFIRTKASVWLIDITPEDLNPEESHDDDSSDESQGYDHDFMKEFLINIHSNVNYILEDKSVVNSMLEYKYPGILKHFRRGDILEFTNYSGYRSQGVFMWDGEKVIDQNTEYDDYGSPAKCFSYPEFPLDYWDQHWDTMCKNEPTLTEKVYGHSDSKLRSKFYWHSDLVPIFLNLKKFVNDLRASYKKYDEEYYYVKFDNINSINEGKGLLLPEGLLDYALEQYEKGEDVYARALQCSEPHEIDGIKMIGSIFY